MGGVNNTRLEVQKRLRDTVLLGFSEMGSTGWDCMEFANASFQRADKVVLLDFTRSSRVSWQNASYIPAEISLSRKYEWLEEQQWQFHIILKRNAQEIKVAEDYACDLIGWLNGVGAERLYTQGIALLRIDTNQNLVYNDNSELYQKRCVFTVKMQVLKELTFAQPEADAEFAEVVPV